MLKNVRDGHFQIVRMGWIADYNHPHTWMDVFLSYSANNETGWQSPAFDALIKQAAATADPQASIRLYRQAEAMTVAAMPRLPLYFYTKSSLVKPYVKGFYPNASNEHPLRWMWIDSAWRNNASNAPAYPPVEIPAPGILEAQP